MNEDLLKYFKQELEYFRRVAPEFAQAHSDIAGELRMSDTKVDDPHVKLLIQAFAFLNARTRMRLEDDFPEIAAALLQVLYPHYLRPFPSATIVQFALSADRAGMTKGVPIKRGEQLETDPVDGDPIRFRTCYPTEVWPIALTNAAVQRAAGSIPHAEWKEHAKSVIRLELSTLSEKVTLGEMAFKKLRFFLNVAPEVVHQLYEAIFRNALGVVVSSRVDKTKSLSLGKRCIRPVGFHREEALVDHSARSLPAYQLITEYFAFPEKFLFFDLFGFEDGALARFHQDREICIDIWLDQHVDDLELKVGPDAFKLGCTPAINLFGQAAEPIRLTHTQSEYRVVPDVRRAQAYEVYSIDRVTGFSADNAEFEYFPFYSLAHHHYASGRGSRFWTASRRVADVSEGTTSQSEMHVSVVDAEFNSASEGIATLQLETTCLNTRKLPFGGGHPRFRLTNGGVVQSIVCLVEPTETRRVLQESGRLWRLISQLSLNHLSLASHDGNAEPLQEVLRLYDTCGTDGTQDIINALLRVFAAPEVARVPGPRTSAVCRGLRITLHFNEDKFTARGLYLFGAVLERFLGMYASLNSFTKTVVTTTRRPGQKLEWPARAGEVILI